jgi:hypothetical protein
MKVGQVISNVTWLVLALLVILGSMPGLALAWILFSISLLVLILFALVAVLRTEKG